MKKTIALTVMVFCMVLGYLGKADGVADTLLLYFPNRIVDFMDIFSCELGFGPSLRAKVWVTRAFGFGGGAGATAKIVKQINRQYGAELEDGWSANFLTISAENQEVYDATRGVKLYNHDAAGIQLPSEKVYDFHEGARDYWSIGVHGAVMVDVVAELNPIELADFVTGIFFIDLKDDDFTGDELRM